MSTLSTIRREISRLHGIWELHMLDKNVEKEKILKLATDLIREHDAIWSAETEPTTEETTKMASYREKLRDLLEAVDPKSDIPAKLSAEIKFSGMKQDWPNFRSMFENTTETATPQEKFLILVNALPNYLKRNLPTQPNAESVFQILKILDIEFGPIDSNQTLDMVERLSFAPKTPLSTITGKLQRLYYQAVNQKINNEYIKGVFQKKIRQILPFAILNLLPMNENIDIIINKMAEIAESQTLTLRAKMINQSSSYNQRRSYNQQSQQDNRSKKCVFCSRTNHNSIVCKQGSAKSRRQTASRRNLCLKCLRPNHMAKDCRSNISCSKCKGQHASCLCEKSTINMAEINSEDEHIDDEDELVALN